MKTKLENIKLFEEACRLREEIKIKLNDKATNHKRIISFVCLNEKGQKKIYPRNIKIQG